MPIYIALYQTIYSSVELYKADFALWINDLSQADPYYVLPVLMTATMFAQQLLMPSATDNPQMKWMMRLMPIVFGFFMLVLPSGLVLYIFVSSLLGILQQWVLRRQRAKAKELAAAAIPQATVKTRQQRRREERQQRG
jgi:YidC/Oxa1 family membrane protein insertase